MKQLYRLQDQVTALATFASILGYHITKTKGTWHIWREVWSKDGLLLDKPRRKYISLEKMVSLYDRGSNSIYVSKEHFNIAPSSFSALVLKLPREPLTINRKTLRDYKV